MPTKSPAPAGVGAMSGVLIRVHNDGYGFIKDDASHEEFFVSLRDFPSRSSWFPGQCLSFDLDPNSQPGKARRAINIALTGKRKRVHA